MNFPITVKQNVNKFPLFLSSHWVHSIVCKARFSSHYGYDFIYLFFTKKSNVPITITIQSYENLTLTLSSSYIYVAVQNRGWKLAQGIVVCFHNSGNDFGFSWPNMKKLWLNRIGNSHLHQASKTVVKLWPKLSATIFSLPTTIFCCCLNYFFLQ